MDEYTIKTKEWLEKRFKSSKQGIYRSHQPIYGFRKGYCDSGAFDRYICTYHIMRALSKISFESLLDVGGAEGFKANLAKFFFNVRVENSDISEEACIRSEEIFQIKSTPADIHNLPFKDKEFDVVLCSETIEHVTDIQQSLKELLRVARKAVVITVPHEPKEKVEKNIKNGIAHGHIHSFELESFDYLSEYGYQVIRSKTNSSLVKPIIKEALTTNNSIRLDQPDIKGRIYNIAIPIIRNFFGKRTVALLVALDAFLCRNISWNNAFIFTILKDRRYYRKDESISVSALKILDFSVPYHKIPVA
jgi:ubiquinone/menaquinone biosynthesis C-methylase UbiE